MVFKYAGDTISIQGWQSAKGLQFVGDNVTLTTTGANDDRLSLNEQQIEFRVLAEKATVEAPIVGDGKLVKTKQGTLVHKGDNT